MKLAYPKNISKLIVLLFSIDVLLTVIYLANTVLGRPLGEFLTRLFDLGAERNIPTWYSSLKLFLVALLFLALASIPAETKERVVWVFWIFALTFLGLSLDEFAGIHEHIGRLSDALLPGGMRTNTVFYRTGIWMFVVAVPFLIFSIVMVVRLKRYIRHPYIITLYVVGFIVFIGSAGGIEILANFVLQTWWMFKILQIAAEEFGEMAGVTIIFWATYELVLDYGITIQARANTGPTVLTEVQVESSVADVEGQ